MAAIPVHQPMHGRMVPSWLRLIHCEKGAVMANNQPSRGWRARWLSFIRRRSPARRISATVLLVLGALLVIIAFLPTDFLGIITSWFGVGRDAAERAHVLLVPAGAAFLIGVPLLLVPRTWHFANAARPRIAPVSVYMDLENQLGLNGPTTVPTPLRISALVEQIQHYVRTVCKQDRADMFVYADTLLYANEPYLNEVFRTLWRQGFTMMDTPHARLLVENGAGAREEVSLKDTADLVMALHAYERALLADGPRHIILVTGDKDFVPLIYQLHYMGHHVHLISLGENETLDLFARKLGIAPVFIPNYGDRSDPRGREALVAAINHTVEVVNASWAQAMEPNARAQQLTNRVAKLKGPALSELGYEPELWLDELRETGLLDQMRPAPHVVSAAAPETHALYLQQFVNFVADDLRRQAASNADHVANLEVACKSVGVQPAGQEPNYVKRLRDLLRTHPKRVEHARALARCAQFLGIVNFSEEAGTPIVHLREIAEL
jgi:uncharacterized LabA/DUF88 family protein